MMLANVPFVEWQTHLWIYGYDPFDSTARLGWSMTTSGWQNYSCFCYTRVSHITFLSDIACTLPVNVLSVRQQPCAPDRHDA
jgi:hypothetical protein